jgi:hypothetical protein
MKTQRYHVTASDIDDLEGFIIEIREINSVIVGYRLYAIDHLENGIVHQLLISGSLKWDGCSDTEFLNTIHFCGGLEDWAIFNEAVEVMFRKAYQFLVDVLRNGVREFEPWKKGHEYTLLVQEYKGEIQSEKENE